MYFPLYDKENTFCSHSRKQFMAEQTIYEEKSFLCDSIFCVNTTAKKVNVFWKTINSATQKVLIYICFHFDVL